jgi:hypothetical protein
MSTKTVIPAFEGCFVYFREKRHPVIAWHIDTFTNEVNPITPNGILYVDGRAHYGFNEKQNESV